MPDLLTNEIEYIYFFYGLSFIILGVVSLSFRYTKDIEKEIIETEENKITIILGIN